MQVLDGIFDSDDVLALGGVDAIDERRQGGGLSGTGGPGDHDQTIGPHGELFDNQESRGRLIEILRQFRPTLVLAHSPHDYHADHRAASALAGISQTEQYLQHTKGSFAGDIAVVDIEPDIAIFDGDGRTRGFLIAAVDAQHAGKDYDWLHAADSRRA